MDTDGMLLKPECILDVQCINQNYMSKYEDAHAQFKYIGHHVDMRNSARKPKNSSPRKNLPGYHPAYPNKPYRCQTCRKTFSQQSNLCKHILIHSGLKPYLCDICDKSFTQQANLIKHRRIHTGDKPFECGVCGRCFSQKANLNKHQLLHTGEKHFRCEFCDKSFVQQANLERHKRTHTGEKPYSCNICEKRFTQRGNMVKHTLVHCAKKQNNEVNCGNYQFGVPLILSTKEGLFLKRCNL